MLSPRTLEAIDWSISYLVQHHAGIAAQIIRDHGEEFVALTNALFDEETLDRKQVFDIINEVRSKHELPLLDAKEPEPEKDKPLDWADLKNTPVPVIPVQWQQPNLDDHGQDEIEVVSGN